MVRHDDVFLTKKQEILQRIERKKHLIRLTEAMSGTPISDGGISRKEAQRAIELLNKDISELEKDLMQLESGENVADEKDTWEDKEKKIEKLAEKVMEDKLKDLKLKEIESEIEENSKKIKEDSSVSVQNTNDTAINPPKVEEPIRPINWFAVIILLVIISSSLYFVIGNSNLQNTNRITPSNFNNNNAEKVTNPLPTPKDIFGEINKYREQNKKFRILWSNDAYRLADFRASDMVKRNYFSHTTPDGKTVSDYIGKYNFYSSSAWGENLCKGCSDPIQTWIGSADDREVLLGGWGRGAVACESYICVFIGVNE